MNVSIATRVAVIRVSYPVSGEVGRGKRQKPCASFLETQCPNRVIEWSRQVRGAMRTST